jgi:citrate synthase
MAVKLLLVPYQPEEVSVSTLQETLAKKIPIWREEVTKIKKAHGDKVVSEVTVTQAYGGMRGVKGMICDTSVVEPDKGLIVPGTSAPGDQAPLARGGVLPAADRRAG